MRAHTHTHTLRHESLSIELLISTINYVPIVLHLVILIILLKYIQYIANWQIPVIF